MNRFALLILSLLLGTAMADAQFKNSVNDAPRHRIMIGAGAWPITPEEEIFRIRKYEYYDGYTTFPWRGSILDRYYNHMLVYRGKTITTGAIFAEYGYRFSKWFDLGMNVTYTGFSTEILDALTDRKVASESYFYLSFTPMARFIWARTSTVNWYSGFGLGVTLMKDEAYTENYTSYNFIPVGLMFGQGKVFGFSELCIGRSGIFNAGIGMRF